VHGGRAAVVRVVRGYGSSHPRHCFARGGEEVRAPEQKRKEKEGEEAQAQGQGQV
jgi:hypothetical protein